MNKITFSKKFTENDIDSFIENIYDEILKQQNIFEFDLTNLEWFSNQGLLLFTSVLHYLHKKNIKFKVKFIKDDFTQINERQVRQYIELWETWKIYKVLDKDIDKAEEYFQFKADNVIKKLKIDYNIKSDNQKIYDAYSVRPFIKLDFIENYNVKLINDYIDEVYNLNNATNKILKRYRLEHPFIYKTISAIISKELYENFLDHFDKTFFGINQNNSAFMSLALKPALINYNENKLRQNFNEEELLETKNFFTKKNKFRNDNFIQYTFLDFGIGIVNSIIESYKNDLKIEEDLFNQIDHNDVLKYAFKHNTSRLPIKDKYDKINERIPRGFFDVLIIVKRYKGLIIIRSNYGKVYFDFANNETIESAFGIFGSIVKYFPGTMISIYIPAISDNTRFIFDSIKPEFSKIEYNLGKGDETYVSLSDLLVDYSNDEYDSSKIYNESINYLTSQIIKNNKKLIFFDFTGWEILSREIKKFIYFLVTDYEINIQKNIIVLNPPPIEFLDEIKFGIDNLLTEIKHFYTHPLPFVYYNFKNKNDITLYWLGVYDDKDIETLNQLLFGQDEHSLTDKDFNNPDNVVGHLNSYDVHGNLKSVFPDEKRFLNFYSKAEQFYEENLIKKLFKKINIIGNKVFVFSGNYYQKEFIELDEIIFNDILLKLSAKTLFKKIQKKHDVNNSYFVSVTSSSKMILQAFEKLGLVNNIQFVFIDHLQKQLNFILDDKKFKKVILISDVFSTGNTANKIDEYIKQFKLRIDIVGAFINTQENENETTFEIISLNNHFIKKNNVNEILTDNPDIIRINPYTNQPIETVFDANNSILFNLEEILPIINQEFIYIKNLKGNNSVYSIYFDFDKIFQANGKNILEKFLNKIKEKEDINIDLIVTPSKSSVDLIDKNFIKTEVFNKHSISDFTIDRFRTPEGWKYPHLPNSLQLYIKNKEILILEDTLKTSNSILQLIEEISLFKPKKIIVLIMFGRVQDQKLEFLSKLKSLNLNGEGEIEVKFYFGVNLFIKVNTERTNPNNQEIEFLQSILANKIIPSKIKTIAENIWKEIIPINIKDYTRDHKYLIINRKEGTLINKHDIILMRDELGKILIHRYYKNNFVTFNKIIYNFFKNKANKYDIEIICSIFLYEPYLYNGVKLILPDFAEIIEKSIKNIVINHVKGDLNLDWNKKDLIQLFFIVFEGDKLVRVLNENNGFLKLLKYGEDSFSNNPLVSVNYILYKLLIYFPFRDDEISQKIYNIEIKEIVLNNLKKIIDKKILSECKRFYSFLSTLPDSNDFASQMLVMETIYWEHSQQRKHDERASLNHHISRLKISLIEAKNFVSSDYNKFQKKIGKIHESWWKIKFEFLNEIIKFYNSFPGFFKPYPYDMLIKDIENNPTSLISIYEFLDDFIHNFIQKSSDINNFNKAIQFIDILDNHFGLDSDFRELFSSDVYTIKDFYEKFIKNIENNFKLTSDINLFNDISKYGNIKIPKLYVDKIIIEELIKNLNKYADRNSILKLNLYEKDNFTLIFEIENTINNFVDEFGNSEGFNNLNSLSNFSFFGFKYKNHVDIKSNLFYQDLIFQI